MSDLVSEIVEIGIAAHEHGYAAGVAASEKKYADAKAQLLEKLRELAVGGDPEICHGEADELLLNYINDDEVKQAFDAIEKWYA